MVFSYSLVDRVGGDSAGSSVNLGVPNQAGPDEDTGAGCGGNQELLEKKALAFFIVTDSSGEEGEPELF